MSAIEALLEPLARSMQRSSRAFLGSRLKEEGNFPMQDGLFLKAEDAKESPGGGRQKAGLT
jgi:hypothetical protein